MKGFHLVKELVYPKYCSPRTQGKLLFQEVSSKPDLLLHLALLKSVFILPKLKPLTIASCCEIWSLLLLLEFATSKGCTCENQDGKSPVMGGILVVASRNRSPDQPLIYMLAWSNLNPFCRMWHQHLSFPQDSCSCCVLQGKCFWDLRYLRYYHDHRDFWDII